MVTLCAESDVVMMPFLRCHLKTVRDVYRALRAFDLCCIRCVAKRELYRFAYC